MDFINLDENSRGAGWFGKDYGVGCLKCPRCAGGEAEQKLPVNRLVTLGLPSRMRAWDLKECPLPAEVITDYAKLLSGRRLNAAAAMLGLKLEGLAKLNPFSSGKFESGGGVFKTCRGLESPGPERLFS